MHVRPILAFFAALTCSLLLLAGCSPASISQPSPDGEHDDDRDVFAEQVTDKKLETTTYDVKLGFIGDICLADNYIPMQHLVELGTNDISQGIDPRFIDQMRSEDIMWANNEFAYSDRGDALPGKAWAFCSKTGNVAYLDELGVDIAGLANNHTFDFGEEAFEDTLTTLQNADMLYVGAGWNDSLAYAPVYMEADGIKVAYVAASRAEYTIYTLEAEPDKPGIAWCYDNTRFLESIREAKANADFVVALPHWGTEHSTELESAQTEGARAYIDAGADCVIGAHPHILQGIEFYQGKPILYSLGNFWFDDYDIDTVLAEIEITGERKGGETRLGDSAEVKLKLYPGVQSDVYTRWSDDEGERNRIFNELASISPYEITISSNGTVS